MTQLDKTGESLYAEHSAKNPIHANGIPRKSWNELSNISKQFWEKSAQRQNLRNQNDITKKN